MSNHFNRRTALAAIAAVPAASLPAIPAAAEPDDPIFAAIKAREEALACLESTPEQPEDAYDAALDMDADAARCVMATRPTTLAGAVALLQYVRDASDDGFLLDVWLDEQTAGVDALIGNLLSLLEPLRLDTTARALPVQVLTLTPPVPVVVGPRGDRQAQLARFQYADQVLRDRYICEGWHKNFDEDAAARALEYFKAAVHQRERSIADADFGAAVQFLNSHGVSLDWIFEGDVVGFICDCASHSKRAAAINGVA